MGDSFEYFGKRSSYGGGGGGGSGSEGGGGGDEDFEEEDVWSVVNQEKSAETSSKQLRTSVSLTPRRLVPTASRIMIPRGGGGETKQVLQQSAPVNIPDWSKIYRKSSRKGGGGGGSKKSTSHGFMDDDDDDDEDVRNEDDEEDEDVDEDKVPPHEWIAKKLARSQISSFSVCEGVGRTLKGRDISKVRNAVLTKTGFLE